MTDEGEEVYDMHGIIHSDRDGSISRYGITKGDMHRLPAAAAAFALRHCVRRWMGRV